MKTTIDLSDALALEAKALAAKRGTTFRAIVEQGIRCALKEAERTESFKLTDKSVSGNGSDILHHHRHVCRAPDRQVATLLPFSAGINQGAGFGLTG